MRSYVIAVGVHNVDVREYSTMVLAGRSRGSLATIKKRVQESRERATDARKRYTDHLQEHECAETKPSLNGKSIRRP